jgi:hypothetical protein
VANWIADLMTELKLLGRISDIQIEKTWFPYRSLVALLLRCYGSGSQQKNDDLETTDSGG